MKRNKILNSLIATATLTGILTAGFPKAVLSATELIKVCKEDNSNGTDAIVYVNHDGNEITVKGEKKSNRQIKKDQVRNRLKYQHNLTESEANSIKNSLPDTKIKNMVLCESDNTATNNNNEAGIVVSIEAAGVQTSQLPVTSDYYVVDFNDQATGKAGFTKANNGTTYQYNSDLEIKTANQWGGAEGSKFITQAKLESIRSYKIDINKNQKYFGFWWSAGDPANQITFKKDGNEVAVFKTKNLVDFIKGAGVSNTSEYNGNPAFSGSGGHENEPFSYVNIFFKKGSYDEIVVATLTAGGAAFESDNHTFSAIDQDIIGQVLPGSTPAAVNDLITTDEDTSKTLNVIGNDLNPNNDLAISKITIDGAEQSIGSEITLASGALLTVESDGQATYDPNGKFENFTPADSETDSFTYIVTDSNGNSDTADVTMKILGVADAPVAQDDNGETDEDTVTLIPVLQNDEDPDTAKENLVVTAIGSTPVTSGQVVTLSSGATVKVVNVEQDNQATKGKHALEYNPASSDSLQLLNDGSSETETFTYTVEDPDGKTGTATVQVEVEGITDFFAD